MSNKQPYTSLNKYFLLPFIVWVLLGGIALLVFDKQSLFAAGNTHHSSLMDTVMYYASASAEGWFSTIVLLLLLGVSSLRNWWYFVAALLCNLVSVLLTQVLKAWVPMPRPLLYFNKAEWIHFQSGWPELFEHSFPSGHTCAGFALYSFLAFLLPQRYRGWGLLFFIFALLVGYSRMYLAAHFFLDVYVGSILGTLFTVIMLSLMKYYGPYFFKREKTMLTNDR